MIINCLICNNSVAFPAGPVSRNLNIKRRKAGQISKSLCIILCKALNIPLEVFKNEFFKSFVCSECLEKVQNIAHVVTTLENLQNTLRQFRQEVKGLIENSLKVRLGHGTVESKSDEAEGIEFETSQVKVDVKIVKPSCMDSSGLFEALYEENDKVDVTQKDLNDIRRQIIDVLQRRTSIKRKPKGRPKFRKNQINYQDYQDLEKEKRLVILLERLDVNKLTLSQTTFVNKDQDIDWQPSNRNKYPKDMPASELQSSSVDGSRKSQRKRKPTAKIVERLKEQTEGKSPKAKKSKFEKNGNLILKEDLEDADYKSDFSDFDNNYEEDLAPPIRFLQFCGKPKKVSDHYCEKCDRNFKSTFSLKIHEKKRHEGVSHPFVCTVEGCQKTFRQRHLWTHHVNFHTKGDGSEKKYNCEACGKGYDSNNSLQRHVSGHTGAWKFPCTQEGCDKGFHRPSELKAHLMRYHENQAVFKCNFCEEKFVTKRKRISHESLMHPDENLAQNTKCEYCFKVFSGLDALKCHKMHLHQTGEYKYHCEICGKGMAKLSWLDRHKLQHSQEKTFKCDLCPEMFRFPNSLAAHKMKHEGNYPFTCRFCEKKFILHSQLRLHELIHSKDKLFVCEYCGKSFSVHTYMNHHVKRMHFKELGLPEPPIYYIKEKNRKRIKKSNKIMSASSETLEIPPNNKKKKKRTSKALSTLSQQHQQELDCSNIISGINVGGEAVIITDSNGTTNVEVEFVNVLEYVVHTTETYETQQLKEVEIVGEGVIQQEVEVHELETQKIETDPFIEFIVTQPNHE